MPPLLLAFSMDYLARGMASCFSFLSVTYIVLRSSQDCNDIIDEKGKGSLLYGFYWKEQTLSEPTGHTVTLCLEPTSHITGMNSQQYTTSKVQHHLGVGLTLNDGSLYDSLDFFFNFPKQGKACVCHHLIWNTILAQFKVFELTFLDIIVISSYTTKGPVNHGKESRGWFPSTHDSWVIVIT